MKKALAVLALSLSFTTVSFAADSITLTLKTHETLILKKISKKRFEKISANATGEATLDYIRGNKTINVFSQEVNESNNTSDLIFSVTGKNILEIEDFKEGINKEIQANINKSFFGNVKSIKISSETMQSLYAASMKKAGLSALKNLRVLSGGVLTSSLITTDMNCKAQKDLLVCEQDATLLIGAGG